MRETNLVEKHKSDSLGSISAVVKRMEESDIVAEKDVKFSVLDSSEEDSDIESETDDEEYQCVVCKLDFVGEVKFEQHRRISQHWG
jgi:stress-induced morphogen